MTSRADFDRWIADVLRPLLVADGGDVEVRSVSDAEVVLALTGAFSGDPGTAYVQTRLLTPAVQKRVGPGVTVRWT